MVVGGGVLEMCHGREQPLLVFWTTYPDVLDLVIFRALGQTTQTRPKRRRNHQKSFNPSPEHANVIAFSLIAQVEKKTKQQQKKKKTEEELVVVVRLQFIKIPHSDRS